MPKSLAALEAGAAGPADAGKPVTTTAVIDVPSDKAEPPPPTAAMRGSCSPAKGIAIAQLVLAILALSTSVSPSLITALAGPILPGMYSDVWCSDGLCDRVLPSFLRLPAIVFLVLVAVKLCKYHQGADITALVVSIVVVLITILPIGLINDSNRMMFWFGMWPQVRGVAAANLTFQVVGGPILGIISLIVGGAEAAAGPDAVAVDDPLDTAGPPPPTAATRGSPVRDIAIAQLVLAILALLANTIALVGGFSSSYGVIKATHWVGNSDAHLYANWWGGCEPGSFGTQCWPHDASSSFGKMKGPAMVCEALSFLLAIVFLILVAVKSCKYKKGFDIAALVVGVVGMVFTIVPIGLWYSSAEHCFEKWLRLRLNDSYRRLEGGPRLDYGPGYAAATACLTFQVVGGLVLGIASLVLSNRGASLSNRGATLLNRGAALSHA